MARDVTGMMQHLKLERARIVGSSLGAEVGLSIAANYPEKVISLVLDGALSSEYVPYGIWEGLEADFEEHVARQLEKMRNTPETILPSVDALVDNRREIFEGQRQMSTIDVAGGRRSRNHPWFVILNAVRFSLHMPTSRPISRRACPERSRRVSSKTQPDRTLLLI